MCQPFPEIVRNWSEIPNILVKSTVFIKESCFFVCKSQYIGKKCCICRFFFIHLLKIPICWENEEYWKTNKGKKKGIKSYSTRVGRFGWCEYQYRGFTRERCWQLKSRNSSVCLWCAWFTIGYKVKRLIIWDNARYTYME